MKEILRNEIAIRIQKQGMINIVIRNLSLADELDDDKLNMLVKIKSDLEIEIKKLKEELKKH